MRNSDQMATLTVIATLAVADFVYWLLGVIAIMYLNSTSIPVMYIKNRMKPNHEPRPDVTIRVPEMAATINVIPMVKILSVRGMATIEVTTTIMRVVIVIDIVRFYRII